jgi:hypothetical protein
MFDDQGQVARRFEERRSDIRLTGTHGRVTP